MARKIKKKKRIQPERIDRVGEKEIVRRLCRTINQAQTNDKTIASIVAGFLWSIGSSLEEHPEFKDAQEVAERYHKWPTLGNSFMAQATLIHEAWLQDINHLEEETEGD